MRANYIQKRWSPFRREESGVAALEFAIVAPVFIVVLAGILVYGLYFGATLTVAHIAAEAARAAVAGVSDTERASLATAKVTQSLTGLAFLDATKMTVSAAPSASNSQVFVVQLNYNAASLPIYAFSGLLPMPPTTIVEAASVQRGGF